jgi:antitoxin MazE
MRTAVRRWGNSLALRIPKSVAADSRIREGSVVDVSTARGKLVVTPISEPRLTLDQLLAGITKENLHDEVDWGAAVGREVW